MNWKKGVVPHLPNAPPPCRRNRSPEAGSYRGHIPSAILSVRILRLGRGRIQPFSFRRLQCARGKRFAQTAASPAESGHCVWKEAEYAVAFSLPAQMAKVAQNAVFCVDFRAFSTPVVYVIPLADGSASMEILGKNDIFRSRG